LITFRWPTPITDSDDDLKSDITDLTNFHMKNDRTSKINSCRLAGNIQLEYLNNKSPNKTKYHNCSTNKSENDEKDVSKSFIPNSENNTENSTKNNVTRTRNVNSSYNLKLTDYIHEDKLTIIINNLHDKNCPLTYMEKIAEMFDCLNYVASFGTLSEHNDSKEVANRSSDTSKSKPISLQETIVYNNNCVNSNNSVENRTTNTNTQIASKSTKPDIHLDKDIVTSNENSNHGLEKSRRIPRRWRKEFIRPPENENVHSTQKSSSLALLNEKSVNNIFFINDYNFRLLTKVFFDFEKY